VPIYEYRCLECGFQDEFLQKLTEPPKTVCPSCGKESFKKLLSAAGFQLKGSGWYATDFRNSGGKPSKGGGAGGKDKDGGKDTSGGASKPEPESSSASTTEVKKEAAAA
jgi:putative FmdB family regulatory protein